MSKRKTYDWEAIEREYRAGQLSIREIGRQYGCSDTAIRKRAKEEKWERDLADKVRKRVREKLVRKEVRNPNASEAEITEANAERGATVQLTHRKDIHKARSVTSLLMRQLEEAARERGAIEEEIVEETKGNDKPDLKRRGQMLRAVSLPAHASTARDLSTTMKNLIALERQAFNLDEPGVTLEEILAGLPRQFSESVRAALTDAVSEEGN